MTLQPVPIIGYDNQGGLQKNKKPLMIPDQAFTELYNAYVFREQVRKREGLRLLGRLQRQISINYVLIGGDINFIASQGLEATATIVPGSINLVGSVDGTTYTDPAKNGVLVATGGSGTGGTINYATTLMSVNGGGGETVTGTVQYYPGLPVMGIPTREIAAINDEQTIWFDTKYAYVWNGSSFQEFIPGTTWAGTDSDFFWATNYRGVNPQDRLFFVTNFVNDAADPMRYTDGVTWTTFAPGISGATPTGADTTFLFQARILIPYFGRLLALNTWEGATVGGAVNIFNRCRFSQIGNPVQATVVGPPFVGGAWRSDVFGKGGFLDAPTNEEIIGATFLNNTLIVFFERTTWQLRYVGEYGLPFIWERIASDLGSESTFSTVLFNESITAVGDRAIIAANGNSVTRIDLQIPDQIFLFQNENDGVKRVHGIRNFQKELVYWCYADSTTESAPGTPTVFPNRVLVYNYRNNTYAVFRDNVTAFGTFQSTTDTTWDSQTIFWDDQGTKWDDFDTQSGFPLIVSGNQQGYVNYYQYSGPQGFGIIPIDEQPTLYISNVSVTSNELILTIPSHNLTTYEWIFITGLLFADNVTNLPVTTNLNNLIYQVRAITPDTVGLRRYDFQTNEYEINFSYTPDLTTNHYTGGGQVAILQNINVVTKDFNPFQMQGYQNKISFIDFLMDVPESRDPGAITGATNANPCVITSNSHGLYSGQMVSIRGVNGMTQLNSSAYYRIVVIDANRFSIPVDSTNYGTYTLGGQWILLGAGMSVQLFLNSSPSISGNLIVGNRELKTTQTPPFYGPASLYAWYRFYASCAGQFVRVGIDFDDILMNTLTTHQQEWVLNAMNLWGRPGGKIMF